MGKYGGVTSYLFENVTMSEGKQCVTIAHFATEKETRFGIK